MPREYTIDHRLSDADRNIHYDWHRDRDPVLTVEPGDVVRFECRDAADGDLTPESTPADVVDRKFQGHPMTGPVEIEGAEPGDVLEVELLSLQHRGIGFTYFYPGEQEKGLLPGEFDEAGLHVWDLEGDVGHFVDGIEVPLNPFPGNLGVAPAEEGPHSTSPPRSVGGNMDIKHLTEGSTVYFPVDVDGGLFSIGDGHAAQGDGEVCVTAIEAPLFITARFDLRSDMDIERPRFETSGPFTATGADEPAFATTGIGGDLRAAAGDAIRAMLDHLEAERDLSRAEAYMLCSVAVDLKISEIVNTPNWVVSAYLPQSIFPE